MDGKVVEDHDEVGETPEDDVETGPTEKQQTKHVEAITASNVSENIALTAPEKEDDADVT